MPHPLAKRIGMVGVLALALGTALPAVAEEPGDLAPYKLVRALQRIQDQIISGDIAAVEMQRFMLSEIDRQLRSLDSSVFDNPRNADAALIYAMSGGNPQTLDFLVDRDVGGNFDNRVTSILRRYLAGKGASVTKNLKDIIPEYRNTRIGPYLELIAANALMAKETDIALKYFDWARVEAPGTIIEEAALRRALNVTAQKGDVAHALPYARRYARRFMSSPYASQFADIFVSLAIVHDSKLSNKEIQAILSLVERKRQREIYLRLARRAAIIGNKDLAEFGSEEARRLSEPDDKTQIALADLYSGLVNIPTDGVDAVLERLSEIPDAALPVKDRFLRDAARIVAEEVVEPPGEESLKQVKRDMVDKEYRDMMSEKALAAARAAQSSAEDPSRSQAPGEMQIAETEAFDNEIEAVEDFVSKGRSRLRKIDALLGTEGK